MIEVEVKYRIKDLESYQQRLISSGGQFRKKEHQEDTYFTSPTHDLLKNDEILRVRRINQNNGTLTYKGPNRNKDGSKSRKEIETQVKSPGLLSEILRTLDFSIDAKVIKNRRFFELKESTVVVDEVEDLGRYAEIERVVESNKAENAREKISALASKLGLKETQIVPETYLELVSRRANAVS